MTDKLNPDYIRVDTCDFCEREAARDYDYCDHHAFVWDDRNYFDVIACHYSTELADLEHMSLAALVLGPDLADLGLHGVTVLHPLDWPTFSFPSPLPSYYPTTER